jgi:hypothetical protein
MTFDKHHKESIIALNMDVKDIVGKEVEKPKDGIHKAAVSGKDALIRNIFFRAAIGNNGDRQMEPERMKCEEGIARIRNGSPAQEESGRFGNGQETRHIREQG